MPFSVSVIIPVHNCLPYLEDTLASVYHQTLDREQIEVLAVDDGSTDGSTELLAEWSNRWPQLSVLSQAASGGAGRPRNVGIEHARGEYVFFLDGDDCLGPEALARLFAMAEKNESDVVVASLVGVNRKVPSWLFREDVAEASLTSGIYYSLVPFKLVRRSLLVEQGIRFPEHMRISEDQHFVASCFLAAERISILSSYDCCYVVRRQDGSNTSSEGLDYETIVRQAEETVEMVLGQTSPGPVQAHLVGRHVRIELLRRFNRAFLSLPEEAQEAMVSVAGPRALRWQVEGVLEELSVPERLLLRALREGDLAAAREVVGWTLGGGEAPLVPDGSRWLLAGPGFDAMERPDELYVTDPPTAVVRVAGVGADQGRLTVTGHALFRGVASADCETTLVLRHAESGREVATELSRTPSPHVNAIERGRGVSQQDAGFVSVLEVLGSELHSGVWLPRVILSTAGHQAERRLSPPRGFERLRWKGQDANGSPVRLTLDVGQRGYLAVSVDHPAGRSAPTPAAGTASTSAPARSGLRRLVTRGGPGGRRP